jgi:hypothetical protein
MDSESEKQREDNPGGKGERMKTMKNGRLKQKKRRE